MVFKISSEIVNDNKNFQNWAFILNAFVIGTPPNCSPPISKNKRKSDIFESTAAADIDESNTDRVCRKDIDRKFHDAASDEHYSSKLKKPRMDMASDVLPIRADSWNIYPIIQSFNVGGFASINSSAYTEPEWDAAISRKDYMQGMDRDAVVKEIAALKYFVEIDVVDD